jgi:hypothetical protein
MDYIERSVVVKKVMETKWESGSDGAVAMEIVAATPAADVAPVKHGEWIEDDYGYNRCSACGWEWDEQEAVSLYCPHCGAKMEEGEIDA